MTQLVGWFLHNIMANKSMNRNKYKYKLIVRILFTLIFSFEKMGAFAEFNLNFFRVVS